MDGNGRWAGQRNLPRIAGHKAGVAALREIVKSAASSGITALSVYAFSSENWKRPGTEISLLMELFVNALQKEVADLVANNVCLRFIGDLTVFSPRLCKLIAEAETATRNNTGLQFVVAINYGGRWDITQACKSIAGRISDGLIDIDDIDENLVHSALSLSDLPEPDLFIRTGGEQRVSNYLLWQLAYTELYFTTCLWPDFGPEQLQAALSWYAGRERRFGRTSEQLKKQPRHA